MNESAGLIMWAIDHPSMILVILGGIYLGIKGCFGVDLAQQYLGGHTNIFFGVIGLAAVWQLQRQRFPI